MAIYHFVTGAPGSGKSTVVGELLQLETPFIVFDIDWLADAAGELAGTSIYLDPAAGKPYLKLWFEVIKSILRNGQKAVFFTPVDRSDVAEALGETEAASVRWLLLDCDDEEREKRLRRRQGWTEARIREALEDGRLLRREGMRRVDTDDKTPREVAREVMKWATEP